ncbi:MAG: FAD-dependent oxidoreductase [Alphaproteobacteria bacterium]
MGQYDSLLKPLTINTITFRNRVFSSSHCPGYNKGGHITERYIRYQAEKARGGLGLAQCGGATGVSAENSYHYGQINASEDWIIPEMKRLTSAIHDQGAACTIQLTHGGRRERWDSENWFPAFSPSCRREPIHRAFPAVMELHDIRRVQRDYAQAARRAREGGMDGVEMSFQSATLVEQFWSPAMNFREDEYGGSLENRVRFGLEALEEVRREVGRDYLLGIRMPGDEMLKDGLSQADCIAIAKIYAASGLIDFISVVAAQGSDAVSSALIWPSNWVPPAGWLPLASAVKAEIDIPVLHAARIADLPTANRAIADGHIDMVGMTRAFIADPHLLKKALDGREVDIRQCVGASYCVDRIISGHDTFCVQNGATGRESSIPHVIPKADVRRRTVVIGAGPGGLEAARVLAERGHAVTLFERDIATGGQINILSKAGWRGAMQGIQRWLDQQVNALGVEVHLGTEATADGVRALDPDIVVVATGGKPNPGWFKGRELATSTWDILADRVQPAETVLLYDENGAHQGPSCAEYLAKRGVKVEVVTPDRAPLLELGETTYGAFMKEMYQAGVVVTADQRLVHVYREGNKLVAVLANTYTQQEEERVVDQVVGECGTLPDDALYFALKPFASNGGEVDLRAAAAARPQAVESNASGAFQLFRVGDAWASRNIHAAIFDSLRICKSL